MGSVILKENNLVYMRSGKRLAKLMGSSCYSFDVMNNRVLNKGKLLPVLPVDTDLKEIESININLLESLTSSYKLDASDILFFKRSYYDQFIEKTNLLIDNNVKERADKKTEYHLNKKKVREKCSAFFGLKQSRKFLAFYSISFPQDFPDNTAFKCFNTVLTRLRKNCGLRSYLWVTERQKNGTIHFHMLTNSYMYIRRFNYYMSKAIETQIKKENLTVNFDVSKYNGVDVRHVNNNKKALNSYLTKYVSKNDILFFRLPYHSSRDISELFTCESFRNENDPELQYILDAIKHIQTFVSDNDYCTIEYFSQKQANGKYFSPPDTWYWFLDWVNELIYLNHHTHKVNIIPLHS